MKKRPKFGRGLAGIETRRLSARISGPHMVRTEVETFDEALALLERRHAFEKPHKKRPVTLRQLSGIMKARQVNPMTRAPLSLAGHIEERRPRKVKPLPPSGYHPKEFHIQCGRCGRPREKALEGDCGLTYRCLGKLLND